MCSIKGTLKFTFDKWFQIALECCVLKILSVPTCCDTLSVWFTPLWIVTYSHHTDSVGSARNDANHCSHFTSDDTLSVCVHHYVVLQWDAFKAGLVMCPVQRDGGVEGGHVSDDRRVGSGCKWTGEEVWDEFERYMYIGDEGRPIYTIGVKMVSTKTSRDVGMVPLSSSCMEKPTGGKSVGTGRGIPWHSLVPSIHTQVNIHQLQVTLDMYFTINPYIWQHLICLVRLLLQAKCYSDLHYWDSG